MEGGGRPRYTRSVETATFTTQLKVSVPRQLHDQLKYLARRRRTSVRQLVEIELTRAVAAGEASGSDPDEAAIRDMAILIAVELSLKLLEASIAGGVSLSRRLVEDAARSAIARVELVEQRLRKTRDG